MTCDAFLSECVEVSELTKGGQKIVYKAVHREYGPIVVKRLLSEKNSVGIERFRREIRAVQLLASPNTPRILSHNADTDTSEYFLAEEYISGPTLREAFEAKQSFDILEVVRFLETALDTLVVMEQNRIVHRDIKPENIIRQESGKYWILDFGISRHLDLESLTPDNSPFGLFTIGYAASEQFRSLKREIDIRSDLFSTGVVATEMCTGNNPFVNGAPNYQTVLKRIESQALPLVRIQGDGQFQLATFIRMIGDNRQTRRPRTATEARAILRIVLPTLHLGRP